MASTDEGRLVEAARAGDQRAFGQLFDQWFDRVHDLSRRIVRDDGIAGEVAQDAFLKAWTKLDTLDDPDAFGGWLLRIARNGSLNRLEKERRSVSVDDETMTAAADARAPEHDPLARMDQAARINLVWDAAAALGPRDASVLDLHLRHGLTPVELAEELGCTPNNAHQVLFTMRKRLATSVKALVLWRAGSPSCDDLRRDLASAGLTSFGGAMVKAIDRHAGSCDPCAGEREDRLAPAALFSAAPVVAATSLIKVKAAAGLASQGVPMAGSSAAAAAANNTSSTGAGRVSGDATSPGNGGRSGENSGAGTSGEAAKSAGVWAPAASGVVSADAGLAADETTLTAKGEGDEPRSGRKVLLLAALALLLLAGVAVVLLQSPGDKVELNTAGTQPRVAASTNTTGKISTSIVVTTTAGGGLTVSGDPDAAPDGNGPGNVGDETDPGDSAGPTATTAPVVIPAPNDPPAVPGPIAPVPPKAPTPPPGTPPAASTTTTAAPVPAPTINWFTATFNPTVGCSGVPGGSTSTRWNLTWTTTDATGVTVGPTGGTVTLGPPDGSASVCAPAGTNSFTLVANGPGGQVSATTS
ncbi:MAG: sigma-70 family RNA polymerase sigma factor [Aquihabitans sp.]